MTNFLFRSVFACLCVLIFQSSSAIANNTWLLPGDAFFPTELTQSDIQSLQGSEDGRYVFHYSNFDTWPFAFCGNAGYRRVVFESVDKAFIDNLAVAYTEIRQSRPRQLVEEVDDGKKTLKETNGIRVLFYPEGFDPSKFKLGLRYNENWADELVKLGYPRDHVRLCCMLSSRDAMMVSWRDATQVQALDLAIPKNDLAIPKKAVRQADPDPFGSTSKKTPAKVDPSLVVVKGKVKAIVILGDSLDDYFAFKRGDSRSRYQVDSNNHELQT